jgi:hypothetical protein
LGITYLSLYKNWGPFTYGSKSSMSLILNETGG